MAKKKTAKNPVRKKTTEKKENAKVSKKGSKRNKDSNRKLKAFVASFFTIIGFIIALIFWKDDKYVMYYANHGLILFIAELIVSAISSFMFIGWVSSSALWVLLIILWVLTWVNALSGEKKRIIVLTDIAEKIKI